MKKPNICVVEGCQQPVSGRAYAVVVIADEEIKVHICPEHLALIARGTLDRLSIGMS